MSLKKKEILYLIHTFLPRMIHLPLLTFRSLITAVICDPSAQLFINNSHCVDKTRAGASARVKSATNTTSGLRSKTLISVFDVTSEEKQTQKDTQNKTTMYHWDFSAQVK